MKRQDEITYNFFNAIDKHLNDLVTGKTEKMFEINEFATILQVHPVHFSTTLKENTGKSPCHFYQQRIMETAKTLLTSTSKPINEIAFILTYDPSNFTKTFKRFVGITPKKFRDQFS